MRVSPGCLCRGSEPACTSSDMGTQAEPARENCRYFSRRRSDSSGGQRSSGDQQRSGPGMRVVVVRIVWRASAASPCQTSGEAGQPGRIVIQRDVWCAPTGESAVSTLESLGGESDGDDSAAERLLYKALNDYVAGKLVDSCWEKSTAAWVTPVCQDVDSVAESLGGLRDQWHHLVLGEPVAVAGLTPLDDIAAEVALPRDIMIADIKCLVQVTGILFGLAWGQPLLVNACLKSLLHDVLVKILSEGIRDARTKQEELPSFAEKDRPVGDGSLPDINEDPLDPGQRTMRV